MKPQLKQIRILSFGLPLFCFLFLITFSIKTHAQNETTFLKARKGIAFTNSGKEIKFRSVRETENSFIFMTTNKTKVEIDKFKITQIDRRNGTKGLRYAATAIGATILVVVNYFYIDNFYFGNGSTYGSEIEIPAIFFSTITGTVAGLIGLSKKKYKTIYTSSVFGNYEPKLNLKTTAPNAVPSLTLSYTF